MELAGIAYASYKFGKQCYSIKYISDTGQHTTHERIMNNIINFSEKTVDTILEILFSHALIK
jgi:nucleoside phosphorylase